LTEALSIKGIDKKNIPEHKRCVNGFPFHILIKNIA